jgi:non-canonical purine NTP pyrophosphatase (RdgB/HAM1 family)
MSPPIRVLLATSNQGKLSEYREMSRGSRLELDLLPNFESLPTFEESAPTFAENSAGKALHYSRFADEIVLADDSGLAVAALGGAPGVLSARYAGPGATDMHRIRELLHQMQGLEGNDRRARFVCVTTIALQGRALAVVSDSVAGVVIREPRGNNGFGYDAVFVPEGLDHTFADASKEEKNRLSHRGKAFRKVLEPFLDSSSSSVR